MTRTLARRLAIAALALPLLLGGCSDEEPEPDIPDATSPSASVTETTAEPTEPPEPVEPILPPEAEGKGIKAAEAFVRHYFAVVDYAQVTGQTAPLDRISLDECDACRGGSEVVHKIYKQGGSIRGGNHTVVKAKVTGRRTIPGAGYIYYATVRVDHDDQEIEGTQNLDGNYSAGTNNLRFVVIRTTDWQVSQWYEL